MRSALGRRVRRCSCRRAAKARHAPDASDAPPIVDAAATSWISTRRLPPRAPSGSSKRARSSTRARGTARALRELDPHVGDERPAWPPDADAGVAPSPEVIDSVTCVTARTCPSSPSASPTRRAPKAGSSSSRAASCAASTLRSTRRIRRVKFAANAPNLEAAMPYRYGFSLGQGHARLQARPLARRSPQVRAVARAAASHRGCRRGRRERQPVPRRGRP